MDKKMSRQILFKPNQPVSKVLEERANKVTRINTTDSKPKISPIVKVELSAAEKSDRLYKWLKMHPLINLNGLCKRAGMDRANFLKMSGKGKELKQEIIESFINILKNYGYSAI